jgi:hypothetical protein
MVRATTQIQAGRSASVFGLPALGCVFENRSFGLPVDSLTNNSSAYFLVLGQSRSNNFCNGILARIKPH